MRWVSGVTDGNYVTRGTLGSLLLGSNGRTLGEDFFRSPVTPGSHRTLDIHPLG